LEIVTAQGLGEAALDKFMLSILASFAEFERDLAASRIAEARAMLNRTEDVSREPRCERQCGPPSIVRRLET
jgi:DNA invertase Pin-like site-specific DNA recombinase